MLGWNELLGRLAEVPRENGSAALHHTASFLAETLEVAGVDVEFLAFPARPYTLRLAGVLALAGGLLYLRWMRERRAGAALALALLLPALLLAELDYHWPVFGWIGADTQHHLRARLPAERPAQRLVFAAHYDTKTDVLDHVQRAPVDRLALYVVALTVLGALAAGAARTAGRRRRLFEGFARIAALGAALYGVASFVALSAGAFVAGRSPGALDDGGACAVLVRLAAALAEAPRLEHTDVEVLLLSAEEVGVQGSWEYARGRFATAPALPTAVVNLEGIGSSADHAVLGRERFTLRSFAPDGDLVTLLDAAYRERFAESLPVTRYGAATDARSFLARGVPAATLISLTPDRQPVRGLHTVRDERSRLEVTALDATLAYLLDVVRAAESRGL